MKFNGFHFNGTAGVDLFLRVIQDPDNNKEYGKFRLELVVNGIHTYTKETTSALLAHTWARQQIMEMIPVQDKMDLFFKAEMRAYQGGQAKVSDTIQYIIDKMESWTQNEREPILQELERIFNVASK